ncbi:hypothetical protein BY458DRAFT_515538 [Sporodiniella umbellata]|nr:hypothetical protein BY458DRAFT_515538 [Sporodiniella umbellata]
MEEKEEKEENTETVTFAAFETLSQGVSWLILGYQGGFQVWNITSPDNVHEVCSIRDKKILGAVSHIHLLKQVPDMPLIVVTEENKQSRVFVYSLKTYSIVKDVTEFIDTQVHEEEPVLVTCTQSNHKVIALGCLSRHKSSIAVLSTTNYKPVAYPLLDVYHNINLGPVFTLGPRLIAYATNTVVLNNENIMTSFSNKLQTESDMKGAAKDIAKEVVSGMKSLGEFSYNQLSNYFGQSMPATPPSIGDVDKDTVRKVSPAGMVMMRDIPKLPQYPGKGFGNSLVAHFRPHTHPISCLTFDPAGMLLMSASKQGHTFHIFSILTNTRSQENVSHVYSLSRGYTDAQVEDCQFSVDSNWCAISTARGTTHIYAINPYGGKPELTGHIHNKVSNAYQNLFTNQAKIKDRSTAVTYLGPALRIKQRKQTEEEMYINSTIGLPVSRLQREPRAKLTATFVTRQSRFNKQEEIHQNTYTIKQQASNMLRHISYLPQTTDPLIFGFDEEYEDSVKINDDVGSHVLYTFHPSGLLTLHRCWVAKTLRKRESGKERLDLSMKKESMVEWSVARHSDWGQVHRSMETNKAASTKEKKPHKKPSWLSNAEISTYALQEQPLWSQSQFTFQTFKVYTPGDLPITETLVMPKEMPEPISSRMNRVKNTNTSVEQGIMEENIEDALAELEDNLSNAMQTSFSLEGSESSISPAKWLSTSSSSAPTNRSFNNKNASVSFEDAYLINMGNGPISQQSQINSLIQLDNTISPYLEEDIIRFESDPQSKNDLYLPDGDNESAYPYESVFERFQIKHPELQEQEDFNHWS